MNKMKYIGITDNFFINGKEYYYDTHKNIYIIVDELGEPNPYEINEISNSFQLIEIED